MEYHDLGRQQRGLKTIDKEGTLTIRSGVVNSVPVHFDDYVSRHLGAGVCAYELQSIQFFRFTFLCIFQELQTTVREISSWNYRTAVVLILFAAGKVRASGVCLYNKSTTGTVQFR